MNKSVILFPLIPLCGMAGKSKLAISEGNPAPEQAANSLDGWLGLGLQGLIPAPRGLPANTLLTAEPRMAAFRGNSFGVQICSHQCLHPCSRGSICTWHTWLQQEWECASYRERQKRPQKPRSFDTPKSPRETCEQCPMLSWRIKLHEDARLSGHPQGESTQC